MRDISLKMKYEVFVRAFLLSDSMALAIVVFRYMVTGYDNIVYKLWKTKEDLWAKYDTLALRQFFRKYKIVKRAYSISQTITE